MIIEAGKYYLTLGGYTAYISAITIRRPGPWLPPLFPVVGNVVVGNELIDGTWTIEGKMSPYDSHKDSFDLVRQCAPPVIEPHTPDPAVAALMELSRMKDLPVRVKRIVNKGIINAQRT